MDVVWSPFCCPNCPDLCVFRGFCFLYWHSGQYVASRWNRIHNGFAVFWPFFKYWIFLQKFFGAWWDLSGAVFMRLDFDSGQSYIGSTEHDVFIENNQMFASTDSCCVLGIGAILNLCWNYGSVLEVSVKSQFPIHQCELSQLLTREALFQQTLRPQRNWPWINRLLKRWTPHVWFDKFIVIDLLVRSIFVDTYRIHVLFRFIHSQKDWRTM